MSMTCRSRVKAQITEALKVLFYSGLGSVFKVIRIGFD